MLMMLYVIAGFLTCSYFLRIFFRKKSTVNLQFYVTLGAWVIFLYEVLRLRFPVFLTLPQPYRMYQYRIEHAFIAIYGWEILKYVCQKIVYKLAVQNH